MGKPQVLPTKPSSWRVAGCCYHHQDEGDGGRWQGHIVMSLSLHAVRVHCHIIVTRWERTREERERGGMSSSSSGQGRGEGASSIVFVVVIITLFHCM